MEVEPTFAVSPSSAPAERPSSNSPPSAPQNRNRTIIIIVVCIIIAICVALVLGFVFIDQLKKRDGNQPKSTTTPVVQPASAKPVDNTENLERIRLLEEQEEQLLNEIEAEKRMEEEEASDKLLETARTMGVLPPKVQHGKVPVFTQSEFTVPPPRQQTSNVPQQTSNIPQQTFSVPQQTFSVPPRVEIPVATDAFLGSQSPNLSFSFSFIPEPTQDTRSWSDDENKIVDLDEKDSSNKTTQEVRSWLDDEKVAELDEKNEPTTESDED
jgi:hypothetical protein